MSYMIKLNTMIKKLNSFLHLVMCRLGLHAWEITKWSRFKDKKGRHLLEEGFGRKCEYCGKIQHLGRPDKYHPSKWVWKNSNGT